jgi:hypothetical protein
MFADSTTATGTASSPAYQRPRYQLTSRKTVNTIRAASK